MNKKGFRTGKAYKNYYSAYKVRDLNNKHRVQDLTRHVLKHPNDKQAEQALEKSAKVPFPYRRVKPRHRGINKGIPLVDKRTGKITERVKVSVDLFPPTERKRAKSVAEQFHDLGLGSWVPRGFSKHAKKYRKGSRATNKSK